MSVHVLYPILPVFLGVYGYPEGTKVTEFGSIEDTQPWNWKHSLGGCGSDPSSHSSPSEGGGGWGAPATIIPTQGLGEETKLQMALVGLVGLQ